MNSYDSIARLYDPWSVSVTEDVRFYVELARDAGGPVVELGVGTGRIAIPTAAAGIAVIGIDSSRGMLEVCAEAAAAAGVAQLLDLRVGDLADPQVHDRVRLVTCPFRAYLHLRSDEERLIFERAEWDVETRTLTLSVRGEDGETTMELSWLSPDEWRSVIERAGFEVVAHYGWFDKRPYRGGEDSVWVARKAVE